MKQLILAIDFDGTLVEEIYPAIGPFLPCAKEVVNQFYADGHHIIIWTCRKVEEVELFLNESGVKFHSINTPHPEGVERYGYDPRKIGADIYIDDRGVMQLPHWLIIQGIVNRKANESAEAIRDN